jgi:hypothetical protein
MMDKVQKLSNSEEIMCSAFHAICMVSTGTTKNSVHNLEWMLLYDGVSILDFMASNVELVWKKVILAYL